MLIYTERRTIKYKTENKKLTCSGKITGSGMCMWAIKITCVSSMGLPYSGQMWPGHTQSPNPLADWIPYLLFISIDNSVMLTNRGNTSYTPYQ